MPASAMPSSASTRGRELSESKSQQTAQRRQVAQQNPKPLNLNPKPWGGMCLERVGGKQSTAIIHKAKTPAALLLSSVGLLGADSKRDLSKQKTTFSRQMRLTI